MAWKCVQVEAMNGNGGLLFSSLHSGFPTFFKRGVRRDEDASRRISSDAFRILATSNVSPREKNSGKQIIMVDPLEAKRLAAKQLQEIKAKEKFQRRRQIEAINGAWAMIGLTAGLVIEGQSGKSILAQLAGYFSAIANFFVR